MASAALNDKSMNYLRSCKIFPYKELPFPTGANELNCLFLFKLSQLVQMFVLEYFFKSAPIGVQIVNYIFHLRFKWVFLNRWQQF